MKHVNMTDNIKYLDIDQDSLTCFAPVNKNIILGQFFCFGGYNVANQLLLLSKSFCSFDFLYRPTKDSFSASSNKNLSNQSVFEKEAPLVSGDPKTGHVRFSNGRPCPDFKWCSDFKWLAIFRQIGSHFVIYHSKSDPQNVRFSNDSGFQMVGF